MRTLVLGFVLSALLAASAFACDGGKAKGVSALPPRDPAVGAALDKLLPSAKLSEEDTAKAAALAASAKKLAAAGDEEAARDFEEQAMLVIGYGKGYSRCGQGSFIWFQLPNLKPGAARLPRSAFNAADVDVPAGRWPPVRHFMICQ